MKSLAFTIYFLIKIHYPCDDINTVRYYNGLLDSVMQSYCFAGIEYDLATDKTQTADLDIYPEQIVFQEVSELGTTTGNALFNPKVFGTPYIRLSVFVPYNNMYHILKHEVGHFLGLRHSNDTLSLMYPIFSGENLQLSRNDSLTLIDIYDDPKH